MANPIDANEAAKIAAGLGWAILNNDKEGREAIYADCTVEDLKRVLRWQTRFLLNNMAVVAYCYGLDFRSAYGQFASLIAAEAAAGNLE